MNPKRIVLLVAAMIVLVVGTSMIGSLVETVDAGEVVVMQDPVDGELHFWTQPGAYFQNFGRITRYKKSFQFWYSAKADQGEAKDQSIRARFNDGGHANISGSLRVDLPLDDEHLRKIHTKYGSQEAIEQQLVRTVVEKAVYFSGPLMSSKESYAERRSDLISFIEDQITHGVYKSEQEEKKEIDPLSGKEKTLMAVKLIKNGDSTVARQEPSPLEEFAIRTYNLSINEMSYDKDVEAQIMQQQQAVMQVQTAMAEARKAEQKAITAEKEGQAAAAEAKWKQEVIKATEVTAAEQRKEVARLAMESAEFTKQEQVKLGEGEAARKRAVMVADGALDKKIAAFVEVNKAYAAELGKQRWVPEVQMGGSGSGGSSATAIIDLLQAKTARDLALDLKMQGQGSGPVKK